MTERIRQIWQDHPLWSLIALGAFFRLIAAFFSAGFAMYDDHFLVVEVAQGWVNGVDIYGWVTSTKETNESGRSLLYPGLVAGLFWLCEQLGLSSPTGKMLVLRLIQAVYSLLSIYYVYKIVLHWSGEKAAREAGLLVALLWLFPYISVRNLTEVVCIPPLLAATWLLINPRTNRNLSWGLWAGVLVGIAFSLRYQSILYAGGLGLAMLIQRDWKVLAGYALGALGWIALMHGFVEWYVWGYPFGKIEYYVRYNLQYSDDYFRHPWYNYLLLLPGLLFPIGLFFFWGAIRNGYRYLGLFLGFVAFLVFHSMMANKQERFIFTIVPMFIALGVMGWASWKEESAFWGKRPGLWRGMYTFFWVANTFALLAFSTYYPKRGKVEAMNYMAHKTPLVDGLLITDGRKGSPLSMPIFYLGYLPDTTGVGKYDNVRTINRKLAAAAQPKEYALVVDNSKSMELVDSLKRVFPQMTLEYTAQASAMDRFLHWLNPKNRTESVLIYKLKPE